MGTNFYYYLNRQGVQGLQGPKGKDGEPGISPTIQIKENTDTEFTLEITDANGTFETPNLRIPVLDKGGTYYRVDRTDGTLYLDFADKADINTFGEVKLATADTVDNPDPDDVRVVTDEILHDNIVAIDNDIALLNTEINKKQDMLIEGENVTLTPTDDGVVISATGGGGAGDVPIATTRVAGKVKPDGTTITVQTDGTITAKDTTYTVNAPITMTNNKIGIAIDNQTIQNVNGVLHANFDELADDVIANTQAINTLSGRVDGVEADIEGLGDEIALKQDTLVSGTNIKTINGIDVLGEGNIEIQGGGDPIDTSKFINTTTTAQTIDGSKALLIKDYGALNLKSERYGGSIILNPLSTGGTAEIRLTDSNGDDGLTISSSTDKVFFNVGARHDGHIHFGLYQSNDYMVDTTMLDGETITFDPNTKKISATGGGGEPIPQTPNVITVGNPTINNGMATGFTTTDYLQFPVILDLQGRPFQIDFAFTTGGNVTTQQNIIDSKFGIALAIANGKGLMAISSNGTNWDIGTAAGTINIATYTTYYARLTWDGTTYRTLLSTDGATYNQDMQLAGTNRPFPTTIYIGGCDTAGTGHTAHPFGGTIDLNKSFIYVAGQLFWHGMDNVGLESRADINLGNITEEGKQVIRDTVDLPGKVDNTTIEVNGNGKLQTTVDINNLETRVEALEQGGGGGGGDVTAGGDNTFTGANTFDGVVNLSSNVYNEGYLTFNNNGFWIKDQNDTEWHITAETNEETNKTNLMIDGEPIGGNAPDGEFVEVSVIIDAYENDGSGYRVWSKDATGYNYCEQWGITSNAQQVTFLKEFKDIKYNAQATPHDGNYNLTHTVLNKATTGMTPTGIVTNGGIYGQAMDWTASGYLAEGQYNA